MEQQPQQQPIDLTTTTVIESSKGKSLFLQGIILRKVSKFVTGTKSDGIMPIPIFYDPKSLKILESSIPAEIRDDYKGQTI